MITGYHTIEDRGNPDFIETEGPFKCTRNDAWLGHGYYFWDTRILLAHSWGKNFKQRGYVICKGEIEDAPDVLWDLDGRIAHQEEFIEMVDTMIEQGLIKKDTDAKVCEVITFMVQLGLMTYKSIRAADENQDTYFMRFKDQDEPKQASMRLRQRVQICLIEKSSVTLQTFKIVFPDKYC